MRCLVWVLQVSAWHERPLTALGFAKDCSGNKNFVGFVVPADGLVSEVAEANMEDGKPTPVLTSQECMRALAELQKPPDADFMSG